MKKAGGKKPRELTGWQVAAVDIVARSALGTAVTFGGGTALAVAYLHHRPSEDLDFFAMHEVDQRDVAPVARDLARAGFVVDQQVVGPRRILVLSRARKEIGHVDISHYPFDPIDRPVIWRGLRVDSLIDMTVNKVQAVLTRAKPRDYIDLFFLLREGPEKELGRLLTLVRAKFETGADVLTLAEQFLRVDDITELPRLFRSVSLPDLRAFFRRAARGLVRKG